MKTKIIEATNGPQNWGKFMVCRYDEDEWSRRSKAPGCESPQPLLHQIGWSRENIWVLDLQTGEGACLRPGGFAPADLNKHKVWVCPLYEPFLTWLYKQDVSDLQKLPDHIDLPDAEFEFSGYRRPGQTTPENPSESSPAAKSDKK